MKKLDAELLSEMYGDKLDSIKAEHGPLLKIMAINAINPAGRALSEVKKYKMDFQVLVGRGSGITQDYQVSKLPQLVIIDKDGIVRYYTTYMQYDEFKAAVLPLIQEIVGE